MARAPTRLALNIQTSLLSIAYLLTTAILGVFWVANQQLPVFDLHYLFGYSTLLLVAVHLFYNLPIVLNWLRRKPPRQPTEAGKRGAVAGNAVAILAALGVTFFLGLRQGASELSFHWTDAGATGAAAGPVDAVIRYHAFSSASRAGVFARAPGIDWGPRPPPFKSYPDVPHVALAHQAAPEHALRVSELGELLFLSAGVTARRDGNALRAAPSSGALFASELYVLVRAIDGLAPGLYHYDPEHERLHVLGAVPAAAASATLGVPRTDDADAVVLLTAIFRRTGYKYRDRAYRYAIADAGHLLENLRLAAQASGVHRATSLQIVDPMPHDPAAERITFPAPEPATAGVHRTILNRRSQRRFRAEAVPLATLSSMLADMALPPQLSRAIRINLVVNRVAGLAPGVYRYVDRHALLRVRAGEFAPPRNRPHCRRTSSVTPQWCSCCRPSAARCWHKPHAATATRSSKPA